MGRWAVKLRIPSKQTSASSKTELNFASDIMTEQIQSDLDGFFKAIDTAAELSQALGQGIPLLGADLANFTSTPLALFQDEQSQVDAALASLAKGATADDIAAALNGAGVKGLTATVTTELGGDPQVAIALEATDSLSLDKTGVTLDAGMPALALTATADFTGALTPTLDVTLDYDATTGKLALDNNATNSLDLGLKESVDATGNATLGILGVSLTTDPTTPATPQVNLDLAVSLADDGTGTGAGITAGAVNATGGAQLDLSLKTNPVLATDAKGESLLPTFGADLKLGYTLGGMPTVELDNVSVDLGGLIDQVAQTLAPITTLFADPIFKQILAGVTGPIPIINDAAQLIPFLKTLLDTVPQGGDGLINALDLAGLYFETQGDTSSLALVRDFASALAVVKQVTDFLNNGSPGSSGLGMIDLGNIVLTGDTTADPATQNGATANGLVANAILPGVVGAVFTMANDPAAAANTALANSGLFSGSVSYPGADSGGPTALASGLVADPANPGNTGVAGLSIPLLTDAAAAKTEIEQILLPGWFPAASPPVLISYTLPELNFDVSVPPGEPLFLPIVGPFGLTLFGKFGATLGFTVGYDTAGLTTGDIADGLFIANSPGQTDIASFSAGVFAGLGVDLGVLQASIDGGIVATVGVGLSQQAPISDITNYIDPTGRLAADVDIVLSIGFGPFSFTLDENIVDITIIDFSGGAASGTIDQAAALASYQPGPGASDQIVLNAGPRAGDRTIDQNDDNESFHISNSAVDVNGNPTTDTLDVAALGVGDLFGAPGQPIKVINGDLGVGNNTLTIDPDVTQTVSIRAGDGNNTFTSGAGPGYFNVGSGNNTFYGGSVSDAYITGPGNDFFVPGAGSVTIVGDPNGHNQISYVKSNVAVQMSPASASNTEIVTRGGQTDYLSNVQYIIGSIYNDTLVAAPEGERSTAGSATTCCSAARATIS